MWGGRAGASAYDGHEYRTCTSTSAIQEPACRGDGGACKGRRGGRTRARYSVGRVGGRGKKRAAGKAEEKKEKTFDSRLALERRVGTYQVLLSGRPPRTPPRPLPGSDPFSARAMSAEESSRDLAAACACG